MSVERSKELWSESAIERTLRRIRTYTSGYGIASVIREKWGMKNPSFGATDPLAYAVNPNPSGWHTRVNESINFELALVASKAAMLDPVRRYEVVRQALRQLPPRSKLALEARITRGFGAIQNPVALIADLAGQPDGLPRLYGVLTTDSTPGHSGSSTWNRDEPKPQLVHVITGHMLDDFLIRSLQTTLIAALLRGK